MLPFPKPFVARSIRVGGTNRFALCNTAPSRIELSIPVPDTAPLKTLYGLFLIVIFIWSFLENFTLG